MEEAAYINPELFFTVSLEVRCDTMYAWFDVSVLTSVICVCMFVSPDRLSYHVRITHITPLYDQSTIAEQ